jgi:hypothetical protein
MRSRNAAVTTIAAVITLAALFYLAGCEAMGYVDLDAYRETQAALYDSTEQLERTTAKIDALSVDAVANGDRIAKLEADRVALLIERDALKRRADEMEKLNAAATDDLTGGIRHTGEALQDAGVPGAVPVAETIAVIVTGIASIFATGAAAKFRAQRNNANANAFGKQRIAQALANAIRATERNGLIVDDENRKSKARAELTADELRILRDAKAGKNVTAATEAIA